MYVYIYIYVDIYTHYTMYVIYIYIYVHIIIIMIITMIIKFAPSGLLKTMRHMEPRTPGNVSYLSIACLCFQRFFVLSSLFFMLCLVLCYVLLSFSQFFLFHITLGALLLLSFVYSLHLKVLLFYIQLLLKFLCIYGFIIIIIINCYT